MKKTILPVLGLVFINACGRENMISEINALPPVDSIDLARFTSACASGSAPQLAFRGYDASNRARYTVGGSCGQVATLQLQRGVRARIKGTPHWTPCSKQLFSGETLQVPLSSHKITLEVESCKP